MSKSTGTTGESTTLIRKEYRKLTLSDRLFRKHASTMDQVGRGFRVTWPRRLLSVRHKIVNGNPCAPAEPVGSHRKPYRYLGPRRVLDCALPLPMKNSFAPPTNEVHQGGIRYLFAQERHLRFLAADVPSPEQLPTSRSVQRRQTRTSGRQWHEMRTVAPVASTCLQLPGPGNYGHEEGEANSVGFHAICVLPLEQGEAS